MKFAEFNERTGLPRRLFEVFREFEPWEQARIISIFELDCDASCNETWQLLQLVRDNPWLLGEEPAQT